MGGEGGRARASLCVHAKRRAGCVHLHFGGARKEICRTKTEKKLDISPLHVPTSFHSSV